MPAVRPEFGPTLPELLRPLVRAHPRPARAVAFALLLGVVAVAVVALRAGADIHTAIVRTPALTFNLIYPDDLERVRGAELLRLQTPPDARHPLLFTVRPAVLPRYRGDINGYLPLFAARLIREMRRSDPSFVLRGEGRVRINDVPGYAIQYQTRVGGRLFFGRRLLLFEDEPGARRGASLQLLAAASPVVPNVQSVGNAGPLKTALRSFRFGSERP